MLCSIIGGHAVSICWGAVLVSAYKIMWCQNLEDHIMSNYICENLKAYIDNICKKS
jgi:hypothetical protein